MKLLVIFPSRQRGGTEEYSLTIAAAAVQKGWQVQAGFPRVSPALIEDFIQQGIPYHRLNIAAPKVRRWRLFTEYLPQLFRTLFLLLRQQPEVVLISLPWPDEALGSLLACGLCKVPTLVVFHAIPFQFPLTRQKLKFYHWAKRQNQAWIGVSKFNQQMIHESFSLQIEEIGCISNGTKLLPIARTAPELSALRNQVRQELGLSPTSQLLVTVGRLDLAKGYGDLIPVIPSILAEFPEAHFVWIGEGAARAALVRQVDNARVADHVHFLGYRSDVPRWLRAADYFVFPTHHEGMPLAVLEAIAAGVPIVASDAAPIPDMLTDGVDCRLFQARNHADLLETLRWAMQHPESMQKLAEQATPKIQEYSEEKMIKSTLDLLEKIASRKVL